MLKSVLKKSICMILIILSLFSIINFSVLAESVDYDAIVDTSSGDTPEIMDYSFYGSKLYLLWNIVDNTYKYRVLFRRAEWGSDTWVTLAEVENNRYIDSNLKMDVNYYYTVARINEYGQIIGNYDKVGTSITLHLDTPKINSAKPYGNHLVLNWDKVDGAYSYKIMYKREEWPTYKYLATTTENTYEDTGLYYNQGYRYTVVCIDEYDRDISSYDSDGFYFCLNLDTPVLKTSSVVGCNLKFSWQEIEGTYQYQVFYKRSTWDSYKHLCYTENCFYEDSGLVTGVTYQYAVRAVDQFNNFISDYDRNYSFTLNFDTPYISKATPNGTSVKLEWNEVKNTYLYEVLYKWKSWDHWVSLGTTENNSFVDNNLAYLRDYCYTVRCIDQRGRIVSDWNQEGFDFSLRLDTPKIKSAVAGDSSVTLSWDRVEGAVKYEIFYKWASWDHWVSIGMTQKNSFVDTGLVFLRKYRYTVRCITTDGIPTSEYDNDGYLFYLGYEEPKITSAVSYGSNLTITWDKIDDIYRYEVLYKRKTFPEFVSLGYTNSNTFTDSNLAKDVDYLYTVRCVDSDGKVLSPWEDNAISFKLHLDTPHPKVTSKTDSTVTFSWDKISNTYQYRVMYKRADWDDWKELSLTNSNEYTDTNLKKGVKYYYTVFCVDQKNRVISDCDLESCYALNFADPPKITNVTQDGSAIYMDCESLSVASYYKFYYQRNGWDYWKEIDYQDTNHGADFGLSYLINYNYRVECYDSKGNVITQDNGYYYPYKLKLLSPKITNAVQKEHDLDLTWKSMPGAEVYEVYYKRAEWDTWSYLDTVDSAFYQDHNLKYGITYNYSIVSVDSTGLKSEFDNVGFSYTAFDNDPNAVQLYIGQSFHGYLSSYSSASWKSSNTNVAVVDSHGFVTAVSAGIATIYGSKGDSSKTYKISVKGKPPVKFAYTYPNSASKGAKVTLYAITDPGVYDVKFEIDGAKTVSSTSVTTDSYDGYKVSVWSGTYTFNYQGEYDVVAYSKRSSSDTWTTCNDGVTSAFITSATSDSVAICEEKRVSGKGIEFIATCEGFLSKIQDDDLAPGNFTLGYGKVVQKDEKFYNHLTKKEGYAYLVQTINNSSFSSVTNRTLLNNGNKFNQYQFDALVSLVYNLGVGIYSDSDMVALRNNCDNKNLSNTTKSQVVNAFCDYHHASGSCIWGLLTRRVDECEMFMIGDYTRDYGKVNRCDIHYKCSRGIEFP